MPTLDELHQQLNALEADLPRMIQDHPDPSDFWPEFVGAADIIEDQAEEHCALVEGRIAAMLAQHGRYVALADAEPATSDV